MSKEKGKKISGERVLDGRLLRVDVDQVIEPGTDSSARREVVRNLKAAAVIPCLPGKKIVLIYQYRYALDKKIWEIPAGLIEQGESPDQCAARELAEETGYRAGRITPLVRINSSPGFSDEVIHIFRAERLTPGPANPDPGENIETRELEIARALEMIADGTITDAKTIIAILMVAGHK
ncbi:MAG: NUDIX hydrolase [Gemmatimonadota bacterium]|nr:NUDIX hydrolase [Gemmatimonadota bacterium]